MLEAGKDDRKLLETSYRSLDYFAPVMTAEYPERLCSNATLIPSIGLPDPRIGPSLGQESGLSPGTPKLRLGNPLQH